VIIAFERSAFRDRLMSTMVERILKEAVIGHAYLEEGALR
jgi:hypothetical protein